jgi:hypothetical protein
MDSLDWSKKYEVLSISRMQLESLGISHEQVASLNDEDMARIAGAVAKTYPDFENRVRMNVKLYLLK